MGKTIITNLIFKKNNESGWLLIFDHFPLFTASCESASVIQPNDNGNDPRESMNAFVGPAATATLRSTGK